MGVALSLLANPLFRKALVVIAVIAALGVALWRIEAHGYNRAMAKVEAETAKEHDRRLGVEAYWQKWAQGAAQRVNELDGQNETLLQQIGVASAANDRVSCLDRGATMRLNGLRNANRRQTNRGAVQPARQPAAATGR